MIMQASDDWKTGRYWQGEPDVISDFMHGSRFANSWMARKAAPGEERVIRLQLIGWDDEATVSRTPSEECIRLPHSTSPPPPLAHLPSLVLTHHRFYSLVQTVNSIGTKRGLHKYEVVLCGIGNLAKRLRFSFDYLLILAIWQSKFAAKMGGAARMLAGVGPDGEKFSEHCLIAELNQLLEGVQIFLPDDVGGGIDPVPWILQAGMLGWAADLLAANALGPWAGSMSAYRPCRNCWWHTACPCAYAPSSSNANVTHINGCRQNAPRNADECQTALLRLRTLSGTPRTKTAVHQAMQAEGFSRLHFPLSYNDANPVTDAFADIMHLLYAGISRYEYYQLNTVLVPDCFSWEDLNRQRKKYNMSCPAGHKVAVATASHGCKSLVLYLPTHV
jgi:hypothetical protein